MVVQEILQAYGAKKIQLYLRQKQLTWGQIHKRFTIDFTSDKIYTRKFYLILRNVSWVSFSNNIIQCISNKTRCIFIQNFLELSKIRG